MPNWRYRLPIKDLFTDQPAEVSDDEHAKSIALDAAARVRTLMKRVSIDKSDAVDGLYEELDEIADLFEDVASDESPSRLFNEALNMLYDAGDSGHRVWVQ